MSWLRWWVGTANDPKWRVIAARAGCRPGDCIAVWAYLLEIAKDNDGSIQSVDLELCEIVLGYEHEVITKIIDAMTSKGMIDDGRGRITAWDKRQPKREDGSAERAKAWREAKKGGANAIERNRTQANAPETETDKRQNIYSLRDGFSLPQPPCLTPATEKPRPFPLDGAIDYVTPFGDIARAKGRGADVNVLAQAFRRFCFDKKIALDSPTISATFSTFCSKHKVAGMH